MSQLSQIDIPSLGTAKFEVKGDDAVHLAGTMAAQNPAELLAPCLKAAHAAAIADGLKALTVDVRELTFVNSSSIRLFIDWAMWIQGEEEAKRYVLRFMTHPDITWQSTSFTALKAIVGDIVEIRVQG